MKAMIGLMAVGGFLALASAGVAQDAAGPAEAGPNSPPPVIKGANDKPTPQQEQHFFIGMVALKDYCKETMPERADAIDAVWAKSSADVPETIVAFSKTDDFAKMLKTRMIFLKAAAQKPDGAASLKSACAQMIARE